MNDRRPGLGRRLVRGEWRFIDHKGRVVRDEATIERIQKLAIPPAWSEVWICPLPQGHIQATGRDVRRRKQYRSTRSGWPRSSAACAISPARSCSNIWIQTAPWLTWGRPTSTPTFGRPRARSFPPRTFGLGRWLRVWATRSRCAQELHPSGDHRSLSGRRGRAGARTRHPQSGGGSRRPRVGQAGEKSAAAPDHRAGRGGGGGAEVPATALARADQTRAAPVRPRHKKAGPRKAGRPAKM